MKKQSISKNVLLNIAYTITNIVFPLITYPYVSRILMTEGLGRVTLFASVSSYAEMVAALGLAAYGIRAVANVRKDQEKLSKLVYELLIINYIGTFIVELIYILLSIKVQVLRRDIVLCVINGIEILLVPMGINWLYSGLERYSYITSRNLLVRFVSLLLILIFVRDETDYLAYAAILSCSSVCSSIINFIYAVKLNIIRKWSCISLKRHMKPMLILFASALAVSVYVTLDTIMLGFLCNDREVGLYNMAVRIKTILLQVINAVSTVLLPRMSFYVSHNMEKEYGRVLNRAFSLVFIITIPAAVFFISESEKCVVILGGNSFADSSLCMKILMPILIISGVSNVFGNQILIPKGKENWFMRAVLCGATADILFNLAYMPLYGCKGAAAATLLAEIVQMGLQFYYSRKVVRICMDWETVIKSAAGSVTGLIVIFHTGKMINGSIFMDVLYNAVIFGFIYFGVLTILKEKNTIELEKNIFEKMVKKWDK